MNIFHERLYMDDLSRVKTKSQPEENLKNEGVRDTRITELEEQLIMAEKRCDALRQQVSYMKMMYACSNQPTSRASPANAPSQPGVTLTGDPKDAVQVIVNEMTQSVNTNTEGTLMVHSNKIEEFWVASRDNDAIGTRKYDFRSKKSKKNTPFPSQKNKIENRQSVSEKIARPRPTSRKSSRKAEKRKPPAKLNSVPEKKPPQNTENNQIAQRMPVLNIHSRSEVRSAVSCRSRAASGYTYLLPTFSYRMKCVPKSCRMGFSFQKIPFVVGKSTNKSHNLGMRIQETLSLIKLTRTDVIAGKTQSKKDLTMILRQQSAEKGSPDRGGVPPQESRCSVKQKNAMTVRPNKCKNDQLRTVLMNIHDEFSRMTEEYDTLKNSLSKKYDPAVENQVQKLEEELDCKEIEINVFMNLYNEVTELRNKAMFGYSQGQNYNTPLAIQSSAIHRPLSCVTTSNSMMNLKMARLLRRIDEFQKDLKTTARL